MFNRYWKPVAVALGVAILAWFTLGRVQGCNAGKVEQHEAQANESKGEANAHQTSAAETTRKVEARKPILISDTAEIQKLRKELATLKANHVHRALPPPPSCDPGPPTTLGSDFTSVVTALEGVAAERDKAFEIIAAQDKKIVHLEDQIVDLAALSAQWKSAHALRFEETIALRLALDAQKSATKAGMWKTRVGSFTVGLGVGALAGFAIR